MHVSNENSGQRAGKFDVIQVDGKKKIVPTSETNKMSNSGMVRVEASSRYWILRPRRKRNQPGRKDTLRFRVASLRGDGLHFTDPHTNMPLRKVTIEASRVQETLEEKAEKQEPGTYTIKLDFESAEGDRMVPKYYLDAKYILTPHKVEIKRENAKFSPVSNTHAQTLFKLVDSFIPRQDPQPTPSQPVRITPRG